MDNGVGLEDILVRNALRAMMEHDITGREATLARDREGGAMRRPGSVFSSYFLRLRGMSGCLAP